VSASTGRPPLSSGFAATAAERLAAAARTVAERAEGEELRRLNRTLRALSNSSHAMLYATSEPEILDAVCRIVVEDCGHAMVWVGFSEDDAERSVRAVAHAGFERGYLDTLHLTWADTERGRGPTGTAIRTGKPACCTNMRTDPRFAPWREEAEKRGYASSVSLPLLAEGRAFGALTIYSREPDPFSIEESSLLTELANDLAHGITTLRLRGARARAEEALRESEQRFRDYAETASDWLWETGPDHRFTQLSKHATTSGILPASMIGLLRWEIASNPEAEAEKWREHRATLEAHLPFRDFVYRVENSTGATTYGRTSGRPFFDSSGKFLGYRGVATDITALIRAEQTEQALRKAQAELAHVTRVTTLGELAASIAHEINQPLAAVIANAEACLSWLDRSPPELAAARRSVEWIVDDAQRAGEVIRRVRALAKKTDTEMALLDVNELVRDAMALVQRELSRNAVALRMELASRLPSIYGDRVQLQQVIINLVMNGIEAMQAINEGPRRLSIRSGQDDLGRVFLTVADTGSGISDADAERIFTPFFTTKSSGMGMGLAICRSIVEAHAGRLSVFRNEEGGATFQVVLPLHQEDAA
jgi:PAS domain S-box-containing protein